ncbi:MAG: hypothetical protein NUV63_03455, partial [Gallionella sp.]|nr:hypothetical protein [Gallionella sp.]
GSKREKRLLFPAANPTYGYLLKMAYLIMQLNTSGMAMQSHHTLFFKCIKTMGALNRAPTKP